MARFTVVQEVQAPAAEVWAALVDWPRHGRWAPMTTVRTVTDRADGVGAGFTARTGIGPLAFDDPMTVVVWEPPHGDRLGRCEVTKSGRVVHGRAWFSVTPLPGPRCRVVWFEDVTVVPHGLTRFAGPLLSLAGRIGFAATLRALARDVERSPAAPDQAGSA
ncbi:SRPBCC family protein [Actinoplanes sp. TRM 88003]|uniref:SRPBCC family protein n=1 Tax=Paractinoplanes aksuensis TaxID=2939490 RepID=A0ABT1DSY1_9ACTN|nr:SRPBCC family protein [Actinoplanes aksuensis]MCO8273950.1 SRPBCC family protein [Actinoplanes aksuensis]